MSDENTTEPVDYSAMYDQGQAPAEPVDVVEETIDEVLEEETRPSVVEEPVVEEVPVIEESVVDDSDKVSVESLKDAIVDIDPIAKLRLREAPEKDSKILAMLGTGTKLTVLNAENPDWLQVQYVDEFSEVHQGFVYKIYVKMDDE